MSTGEGVEVNEITTEITTTTTEIILSTSPILSAIADETISLDEGNGTGALGNGSGVDLGVLKDVGVHIQKIILSAGVNNYG